MFFYVYGVWQKLGFIGVSLNVATPRNVVYDGQPPVQELQCNQNQSVDRKTPKKYHGPSPSFLHRSVLTFPVLAKA